MINKPVLLHALTVGGVMKYAAAFALLLCIRDPNRPEPAPMVDGTLLRHISTFQESANETMLAYGR
jgi:hypothetical protein